VRSPWTRTGICSAPGRTGHRGSARCAPSCSSASSRFAGRPPRQSRGWHRPRAGQERTGRVRWSWAGVGHQH
jgi:hypothetical protein